MLTDRNSKDKILLVDDDPIVAQSTTLALEINGYIVDQIESGKMAIEIIKNNPTEYKTILLDLMMHDISGHEVLIEIKEIIKQYNISVIVHSGLHSASEQDKVIKLGAKGFISKPYVIKSLLEAVELSMLSKSKTFSS
ncbi:MAG: response regulator [Rickettsiaceae bacterium]|nr:MAG: response regulator [Rickettsiaceae bacterium]